MKKRRFLRRRRLQLVVLAAALLWLVHITAESATPSVALEKITQQSEFALALLRTGLGAEQKADEFPSVLTLALSQSAVLLSGRDAVLSLRRSEEIDTPTPSAPGDPVPPESSSTPIPETADPPDTPLVIVDNGVPARTLVPASADGYVVSGLAYIQNRSSRTIDETIFSSPSLPTLTPSRAPQVLILHTHGSEAYTMPPGEEYIPTSDFRTTDTDCSVVRIGTEIASVLRSAGISVIHDKTLYDYPRYSGAYDRSLGAIEDHLARHPTISLVLDIHRDAISDNSGNTYKVVGSVGGLNAAQMSFVIGTDGGGLSHPNWRENLALAATLQNTIAADYPTLMRPITVRNSRYNQHVSPAALLVEMGAAGNSPDEALLSARILAGAILETMFSQEDRGNVLTPEVN